MYFDGQEWTVVPTYLRSHFVHGCDSAEDVLLETEALVVLDVVLAAQRSSSCFRRVLYWYEVPRVSGQTSCLQTSRIRRACLLEEAEQEDFHQCEFAVYWTTWAVVVRAPRY